MRYCRWSYESFSAPLVDSSENGLANLRHRLLAGGEFLDEHAADLGRQLRGEDFADDLAADAGGVLTVAETDFANIAGLPNKPFRLEQIADQVYPNCHRAGFPGDLAPAGESRLACPDRHTFSVGVEVL